MKECRKCYTIKDATEFTRNKNLKDGLGSYCKICHAKYNVRYKEKRKITTGIWQKINKEHRKQYTKTWNQKNPDKIKSYIEKHKKKRAARERIRRLTDINYRLSKNLRRRIHHIIKGKNKKGSAVRDLGCSLTEFREYLQSKFQPGMTWDNYGEWHIDHIKPLSKFNLQDLKEFQEACHYSNLQPLWAQDNRLKRDKYVG